MPLGSPRRHDWRPFPEARSFVRSLGLRSFDEWQRRAKSQARPRDIPSNPNLAYPGQWTEWADWLGTRRRGRWRPFDEARRLVRSLGLRSHTAWCEWAESPARLEDIPSRPDAAYRSAWVDWSDWLGSRRVGQWRPYAKARAFVRSLKLGSFDRWCAWAKSPDRPPDIPSSPHREYRAEWAGWPDWLRR